MVNSHENFKKGIESAKIRSPKQAIITGLLQSTVISIAIFNDFPIAVKILIFVFLQFALGIIMSSKWVQSKWNAQLQKKRKDSFTDVEQFLTEELARNDPGAYTELSLGQAIKKIAEKNRSSGN